MDALEKIDILIVDDRPENLISLEAILEDSKINIIKATSGNEALGLTLENDFALVLLDVQMPGMDGFETAELMRGNKKTRHVPIIFVTAINKEQKHIFKGYEAGAVDYIFKPLDPDILNNKVKIFIDLYEQKKIIESKNIELNDANNKILEHQKEIVEEERLKVLLQLAGATAHELNQPLMVLLGNLEILDLVKDDYSKILELVPKIKNAGEKIASIVKKIQHIRHDLTVQHDNTTSMLKLDLNLNVLSIEDSDENFELFSIYLKRSGITNILRARRIEEAFIKLEQSNVDIILLDYDLPDGTGLEFLEKIYSKEIEIPVVLITGKGSAQIATDVLKAGAYDYLSKMDVNKDSLIRVINTALEKFRLKKEIEKSMEKMAEMSTRDQLTQLYNRRYMQEVLEQEFGRSNRYKMNLSCLLLDLDFFKQVNDNHGHMCGDFVLKEFARRLILNKRKSDYLFRYGGEEFMILLPQTDIKGAWQAAEKIRQHCEKDMYDFEGTHLNITVSIGIASVDECKPKHAKDLLSFADKALYKAKADGRNCVKKYQKSHEDKQVGSLVYGGKGVGYLKNQMMAILDKTKRASMTSIELLLKDIAGKDAEDETNLFRSYLGLLGKKLRLPGEVIEAISRAATFHNCFQILLGTELLQKQEALTQAEWSKIKHHPHMLTEMIELFDFLAKEKIVLLYHHENYDGSGYPEGISGDEIPLGARMFTVIDAYIAMTSKRPYRDMISSDNVLNELVQNAGTQFDPMMVGLFLDIIDENELIDVDSKVVALAREKLLSQKG